MSARVLARFVLMSVALLLVFTGVSLVAGEDLVQPDGRLNQVAHFGGDAIYCVDDNFVSTNNFPAAGGFRMLNSNGQEVWFIPAATIDAAVAESIATDKSVLVAEGAGTYGPTSLYTYFDGKDQVFVFTGMDEFGKPNSLTYQNCTPVGPTPERPGTKDEELCTLVSDSLGKRLHGKALTPVMVALTETTIPCSACPEHDPLKRWAKLDPYCVERVSDK